MKAAPIPSNDPERLQSLYKYNLLDTLPEEVYDDITCLASEITGTPISLITLVDKDRQWFKSKHNFTDTETPRELSFCAHAILHTDEVMVVPDARYDERFHDNPLTTGEPYVVFYAGVPIVDNEGHALGTLCVIDSRPRELSDQKLEALKALSKLVKTHFELRKTRMQLEQYSKAVQKARPIVDQMASDLQQQSSQGKDNNALLLQQVGELQSILNA